jgi:hypothetical protein
MEYSHRYYLVYESLYLLTLQLKGAKRCYPYKYRFKAKFLVSTDVTPAVQYIEDRSLTLFFFIWSESIVFE